MKKAKRSRIPGGMRRENGIGSAAELTVDFFGVRVGQLEFLFEYHDGNEQADDREDCHQQAQAGPHLLEREFQENLSRT